MTTFDDSFRAVRGRARPDYEVRAFYGEGAARPKVSGALAFQTWHIGARSKDLEVEIAQGRGDIGKIEVRARDGAWTPVPKNRPESDLET